MEISRDHPRYRSLVVRERMSELVRQGVVAPTGLIAHGRGEAFDYMLGERTTGTAANAEKTAAAWLLEARRPVITVNGNAAGLCADGLLSLARAVPARVEVNLFHRSPERVEKVVSYLESRGGKDVLGRVQSSRLEGIASDRAMCCTEGIYEADVVLIPLEDGDRAGALVKAGKTVLAIDLNPLSRTSLESHVTVVDELTRAVPSIERTVLELKDDAEERKRLIAEFDNAENLRLSREAMCLRLKVQGSGF
ncbi:MAG: phosphopantothenate/pantothenate synthetase [Methanomassiliicoccus sp.]|nr:phosphopantothenate/pantothenate synthetase [Methanomassiliicoccus sp.]